MRITEHQLRQLVRNHLIFELMGPSTTAIRKAQKTPSVSGDDLADALDWGLIGFAFAADFIPGVGTVVSTAANLGSIGLALKRENWLGAGLGITAILVPAVGDAIAGVGKAVQSGIKLPKPILNKVLKGLAGVGKYELSTFLTGNATKLGIELSDEVIMGITKALVRFKKDLTRLAA